MNVLILGGTVFLGRHLVDSALKSGHNVTLFNRGQHKPELYPEVEKLRGDRNCQLDALQGRNWDAVIDTCGYIPRIVAESAKLLANLTEHYTFISSVSAYGAVRNLNADESKPVTKLIGENDEEMTGENYGALKALCEIAAESAMPGRTLNIRPGLIVGPWDPTDRFNYWIRRVNEGGEVLAPGRQSRPVQFIDARDLSDWIIQQCEKRAAGVYNATGPAGTLTMQECLNECKSIIGSDTRFHWADDKFLEKHKVEPWSDLPLWIPDDHEMRGFCSFVCSKATRDGLTFRPLAATISDTLQWIQEQDPNSMKNTAMSREREKELLSALHATSRAD